MPVTYDPTLPEPNARSVDRSLERRARVVARVMQIVRFFFGFLYVTIGLEIVLEALAARDRNGFKQLLDAVTDPFLGPFRTLLPTFSIGGSQLIFSYFVALVVYVLLYAALLRLARMITDPRPTI